MFNPSTNPILINLGKVMLENFTEAQLLQGYGMTEPDAGWFGYHAWKSGDIEVDGTLT